MTSVCVKQFIPMTSQLEDKIHFKLMFINTYDVTTLASKDGLFNKSSCLAPALGVTKCLFVSDMILVTLRCST